MKKILTLVFFVEEEKILLGYKKRGFGKGCWNGFGGKVEAGESLEEAAKREAHEECGLEIGTLEKRAVLEFSFEGKEDILQVHTFLVASWKGEIRETEEMKPKWFSIREIPYDTMWSDDKYWLPLFLEGEKLRCHFLFDTYDEVVQQEVKKVKSL